MPLFPYWQEQSIVLRRSAVCRSATIPHKLQMTAIEKIGEISIAAVRGPIRFVSKVS